jgi:hypothetical protein
MPALTEAQQRAVARILFAVHQRRQQEAERRLEEELDEKGEAR